MELDTKSLYKKWGSFLENSNVTEVKADLYDSKQKEVTRLRNEVESLNSKVEQLEKDKSKLTIQVKQRDLLLLDQQKIIRSLNGKTQAAKEDKVNGNF